jgi:choline dehydrogenase-like flavoprotein
MSNRFDIIIIGSGAGGGTLALKLAASGKRILILERGGYLPREKENWDTTEVFVKNRYVSEDTWYDKEGKAFQPGVHYFVGGATKMFGAALFRLRQQDFIGHSSADGMTAPGQSAMRIWNPITLKENTSTTCTAGAATTPRIRLAARLIRIRRSATSRVFRQSQTV